MCRRGRVSARHQLQEGLRGLRTMELHRHRQRHLPPGRQLAADLSAQLCVLPGVLRSPPRGELQQQQQRAE